MCASLLKMSVHVVAVGRIHSEYSPAISRVTELQSTVRAEHGSFVCAGHQTSSYGTSAPKIVRPHGRTAVDNRQVGASMVLWSIRED
jgi:hypothetical protein